MERTISLGFLLLNGFLTHFNWSWHLFGRVTTPWDPTHCTDPVYPTTDPVYPIHKISTNVVKYRQMSTNIDKYWLQCYFSRILNRIPGFFQDFQDLFKFQGFSRISRISRICRHPVYSFPTFVNLFLTLIMNRGYLYLIKFIKILKINKINK